MKYIFEPISREELKLCSSKILDSGDENLATDLLWSEQYVFIEAIQDMDIDIAEKAQIIFGSALMYKCLRNRKDLKEFTDLMNS